MDARAWARGLIALLFLTAGLLAALHYPIAPAAVSAAFVAWVALCRWRPLAGLATTLALLPILGFAAWTGWLVVEELDLLLAGLAVGGYSSPGASRSSYLPRLARWRSGHVVGPAVALMLLVFGASSLIALIRGYPATLGPPMHWTQGYFDPLNSVRLFKPFAWVAVLLPVLVRQYQQAPQAFGKALSQGMVSGLGLCSIAVLWERAAFPGVLNFSSDYRTTGLFWEMHVGGAALDGYLALAMPFAIHAVLHARRAWALAFAVFTTLLGAYACLTTFSRGVYLALPASIALMAVLMLRAKSREHRQPGWQTGARAGLILGGTAAATWLVFEHGGYRATGAALSLLAGVILSSAPARAIDRGRASTLVVGGLLGGIAVDVGSTLLPKGPYILHGLAMATFTLAWSAQRRAPTTSAAWMLAAVGWMTVTSLRIAWHWGGPAALWGASPVVAGITLLGVVGTALRTDIWPAGRRAQLITLGAVLMTSASVAVFVGGAYMGSRFSTSVHDLEGRLRHWHDAASLLNGPTEWLLGKGLGQFPAAYFYHLSQPQRPGSYAWHREGSNGYVALSAPGFPLSWGDFFRLSQRMPAHPGLYRVTLDARAQRDLVVQVEVCEKHLLYPLNCATREIAVRAGAQWHRQTVTVDASRLTGGSWYAPRLAMFSIAVASPGAKVDLDNLLLEGPAGRQTLRNPGFNDAMTGWFITSDRHHLPWHIKSLPMHLLFEQGLIGLTGFLLLAVSAFVRLSVGPARTHPLAPSLAGALAGFLTVGLFDSLFDVPRVSWVFCLLTASALLVACKPADGRPNTRSTPMEPSA